MKTDYKKLILRHLFRNGECTRTEISDYYGLRKNTINETCSLLVKDRFLINTTPGRNRNAKLSIHPGAFTAIGMEHRMSESKIVLMDALCNVISKSTFSLRSMDNSIRFTEITCGLKKILRQNKINKKRLTGIGFSDFVTHSRGNEPCVQNVWMPGWGGVDVAGKLKKTFCFETLLFRTIDIFSTAEHVFGAFRDESMFMMVQLDEGVGISIFNGICFMRGETNVFGEIGHSIARQGGDICKCGNRGCLETIAGIRAIEDRVKASVANGAFWDSTKDIKKIGIHDIIKKARAGNKLALLVLEEAGTALGNMLSIMVNVLGIRRIALNGILTEAGDLIRNPALRSLRKNCIPPINQDVTLITSELGEYAGAMGAAYLTLDNYLK
jgi:predicted NBD/HSP70 family sugar kinase